MKMFKIKNKDGMEAVFNYEEVTHMSYEESESSLYVEYKNRAFTRICGVSKKDWNEFLEKIYISQ